MNHRTSAKRDQPGGEPGGWVAACSCGFEEFTSSRKEARNEARWHKEAKERKEEAS